MIWVIIIFVVLFFAMRNNNKKVPADVQEAAADTYKPLLAQHIEFYNKLTDEDKLHFEQKVAQFLSTVHVEGVGLEINDTDRIMIASSAVIPIFAFKDWSYRNVTNVLLYPDTFDENYQFEGESGRNIMGMVGSGYMNGQMILSRNALQKGFSSQSGASNTGIHEFVHLLDKADGATDGIPEGMLPHEFIKPWVRMMHQEIHKIREGSSDIDPYAATNEAEFFAVVSEYFFEKPDKFQAKHPELYDLLSKAFGQDPANN